MGIWGSHAFSQEDYIRLANMLSPSAKQAVLGALSKFGTFRKGTWDGCVFNAAGKIVCDENIDSTGAAAELFDMERAEVQAFIKKWDRMSGSDEESTRKFREVLTADPEALSGMRRDISVTVHESDSTKTQREFDAMVADLDLDTEERSPEQQEFATSVAGAAELLFT